LRIPPSRRGARLVVSHAQITVNGGVVNIASYTLKPGDVVAVREKSKTLEVITNAVSGTVNKHAWLDFDRNSLSGKFISRPERSQIPENIKEQLIVELYSK
jgi:small subunit ribosomal protein S4